MVLVAKFVCVSKNFDGTTTCGETQEISVGDVLDSGWCLIEEECHEWKLISIEDVK